MRKFIASFVEIIEVGAVALGAVFLIRSFLIQPFLVSGSSMVPTFSNGDYLLIDELTYHVRQPERGEVVVFRFPLNESTFFIKRIIGLPGERVKIDGNRVTIYNSQYSKGLLLDESYLPPGTPTDGNIDIKLNSDEYYVLGDNRLYSYDSRRWGVVKKSEVIGLVRLRLWPLGALRTFAAPSYQ